MRSQLSGPVPNPVPNSDSAPGAFPRSFHNRISAPEPHSSSDPSPGTRAGLIQKTHKHSVRLSAAALPLVLTVSVLLLLGVLALIALQERSSLFFARLHYIKSQHAFIRSGFLLYEQDSTLARRLKENPEIILFDSLPLLSRLHIRTCRWGLYEAVTVTNHNGSLIETRLLGNGKPWNRECNFYYPDGNTRLTLAGRCALKGVLLLPQSGLLYGQMGAEFYRGEKAKESQIYPSGEKMPCPSAENLRPAVVWSAFPDIPDALQTPAASGASDVPEVLYASDKDYDSLHCNFASPTALAIRGTENGPERRSLAGQIILYGDSLYLDSLSRLQDILVTARVIRIGKNFKGAAQFFARDTFLLEEGAELTYPSGIYLAANRPESYLEIGARCKVNGYVIADGKEEPDPKTIRYRQHTAATVRGMVYIRGTAHLQGIVTGSAFIERAAYHSPEGYYDHTLYNVTVLENPSFAFPLWLEATYPKKEIKRL